MKYVWGFIFLSICLFFNLSFAKTDLPNASPSKLDIAKQAVWKILAFEETERLRVEDTVFFIGKNYAIPIRFEFLSCWSFRSKVYGCESRF